jgi:hypothetical protein
MRVFALAAFAVALAVPADATTTTSSGLWGFVRRGPVTPVCMVGKPCDEPAANVKIVFTRNGKEAARVLTRRDGSYRVDLRPGRYGVRTSAKLVLGSGITPARVAVPSGRRTRVDFMIDTGIRAQ